MEKGSEGVAVVVVADINEALPPEIVQEVFLWLDWRSLVTCLSVCRAWHHLVRNNNALWRPMCLAFGWRRDRRHVYQQLDQWEHNLVYEEVRSVAIRELQKEEIQVRNNSNTTSHDEDWFSLFKEFYSSDQPCIPRDLSGLRHYEAIMKQKTSYAFGAGVFILARPSTKTLKYVQLYSSNNSNNYRPEPGDSNDQLKLKDLRDPTLVLYNYNPRVVRDYTVWVGSNLPSDHSLFESDELIKPMYCDIDDVNELAKLCPFCLTTPARWRVIMRLEMCLSHEDQSAFEAQCHDCGLFFLFGYGHGC